LTARGIPVAGEYEVSERNAQAMNDHGQLALGGSLRNITRWTSPTDIVLMGEAGHIAIAQGKDQMVRPLKVYPRQSWVRGFVGEMSVKAWSG